MAAGVTLAGRVGRCPQEPADPGWVAPRPGRDPYRRVDRAEASRSTVDTPIRNSARPRRRAAAATDLRSAARLRGTWVFLLGVGLPYGAPGRADNRISA